LDSFQGQEYLVHLVRFVEFIINDPELSPYSRQLMNDFAEQAATFDRGLPNEVEPIIAIRKKLASTYPTVDDSGAEAPKDLLDNERYRWTLGHFDDLCRGESRLIGERINTSPSHYDDDTLPGQLLMIIKGKLRRLLDDDEDRARQQAKGRRVAPIPEALDRLWAEMRTLEDKHKYGFRRFVNLRRTSPGQALVNAREVARRLNIEPGEYETLRDTLPSFQEALYWGFVEEVLYRDDSDTERLGRTVGAIRRSIRVAYEGLREVVGRLHARMQIVERYKSRCMWYNATAIRQLASKSKQRELGLTRHLALYLFDQGIPVTTRQRLGVHELDIVDLVRGSVVVEAKVYAAEHQPAQIKRIVLRGISQLHAYINGLDAALGIREGYLVIYRLGGRLLDLPRQLNTPRFTIVPVLIDVGLSEESGSRQPPPVILGEDEIETIWSGE